ncbi:MAG: outer membrane lipoprotein carrier protein LolA [Aquificae bacterium]|nr:outer membrane lipoprotein carrier protein LolA [Aquificota bacterium]
MRILAFILSFAGLLFAQDIKKLEELFKKTETIKVSFVQRVKYEWYPREDVSKGVFYADRKGRFRLEYYSPDRITIVSDGKKVYVINYEEKKVYVEPVERNASPVVESLFLFSEPISEVFELVMEKKEGEKRVFLLRPKKRDESVSEVEVVVKEDEIAALRIYDSQGTRTTIEFIEVKRNFSPSARLFLPSIPEGFKVVGDE